MSTPGNPEGRPPTEEELRLAYEEELKRIRVEDVLVQTVVSLLNLGGRRAGLAPGTEGEADPQQLHQAIEGVRVLLPLVEPLLGPEAGQVRQALSQLQMAYAKGAGGVAPEGAAPEPGAAAPAPGDAPEPERPEPPKAPSRLWVPGQ
jgi:hypothetical protein